MLSGFMGVYRLVYFYRYFRFYQFIRGGYIAGRALSTGNDLIREAGGGVVAVSIQYRLGLFGFLHGQKIKDGGALNVGLCKYLGSKKREMVAHLLLDTYYYTVDQQAALEWVQKHVSQQSI